MKADLIKHQPREHAVLCPGHGTRRRVETWNLSGLCDGCERRRDALRAELKRSEGVATAADWLSADQRDGAAYDRGRYFGVIL